MQFQNEMGVALSRMSAGIVSAAFLLGMIAPGAASAKTTKEVDLATASQALTYCQSGKMPAKDVAYFNGTAGEAQFGPSANCVQMVPTGTIKKAIAVTGKKVAECTLVNAKTATLFCNDGGMGEYDIAYIKGKVAEVEAGQGYGCSTNQTSLSIGNAICK